MYFPPLLAVLLTVLPTPRPAFAHPVDLSLRTRHLSQLFQNRNADVNTLSARAHIQIPTHTQTPISKMIEARHPRGGHNIPSITLPHMLEGRAPAWVGSAGAAASQVNTQMRVR